MSDYLTCGDTALQTHELRMTIQDLETVQSGKKATGFKLQFEVIALKYLDIRTVNVSYCFT